jgi:N-acetylneuraminate synthase
MYKLTIIVKKKNIEWFASAWDIESLKFLDYFENINHHKIASAMIIDKFFLN